ncbi:MAG: hypothetical protein ABI310_08160, partial [Microbacteriaceae bacterium]
DHRDSATAVNLVFARKLRLVVRRAGEYRLTRAGEQARSDPVALMNACVEGYWRASRSGDDATGLYVLMGVERGLAGDELIALVAAALASDQAEPRRGSGEWDGGWDGRGRYGEPDGFAAVRQIEECASFLARFGAFSIDGDRTVVTANAAALVLAFLTR